MGKGRASRDSQVGLCVCALHKTTKVKKRAHSHDGVSVLTNDVSKEKTAVTKQISESCVGIFSMHLSFDIHKHGDVQNQLSMTDLGILS